jgi:hypothetical protein
MIKFIVGYRRLAAIPVFSWTPWRSCSDFEKVTLEVPANSSLAVNEKGRTLLYFEGSPFGYSLGALLSLGLARIVGAEIEAKM